MHRNKGRPYSRSGGGDWDASRVAPARQTIVPQVDLTSRLPAVPTLPLGMCDLLRLEADMRSRAFLPSFTFWTSWLRFLNSAFQGAGVSQRFVLHCMQGTRDVSGTCVRLLVRRRFCLARRGNSNTRHSRRHHRAVGSHHAAFLPETRLHATSSGLDNPIAWSTYRPLMCTPRVCSEGERSHGRGGWSCLR